MADINQDKLIEEHLKRLLSDYSVGYTEEQKTKIINEFQHFKLHNNNIKISFREIIRNKTLQFFIGTIILVLLLIYVFVKIFPSEKKDVINNPPSEPSTYTTTNNDTCQISPYHIDSAKDKSSATLTIHISPKDTISNKQLLNSDISTQITETSPKTVSLDTLYNKPKRKKKRISKKNTDTDEIVPLPLLEPQKPQSNPDTREEE